MLIHDVATSLHNNVRLENDVNDSPSIDHSQNQLIYESGITTDENKCTHSYDDTNVTAENQYEETDIDTDSLFQMPQYQIIFDMITS